MSLEVYLYGPAEATPCECKCGNRHTCMKRPPYFQAVITHNVIGIASEANLYVPVWHPETLSIYEAWQLVEPLRQGIGQLRRSPELFKKMDNPNGWGTYDQFLPWLEKYLQACMEYPEASVEVSR